MFHCSTPSVSARLSDEFDLRELPFIYPTPPTPETPPPHTHHPPTSRTSRTWSAHPGSPPHRRGYPHISPKRHHQPGRSCASRPPPPAHPAHPAIPPRPSPGLCPPPRAGGSPRTSLDVPVTPRLAKSGRLRCRGGRAWWPSSGGR